jgi:hypothetical protein
MAHKIRECSLGDDVEAALGQHFLFFLDIKSRLISELSILEANGIG